MRALALELREAVVPHLGLHAGRAHGAEAAVGGDVTFDIDAHAERALAAFMEREAPEVAYYSEDRGLVRGSTAPGRRAAARPSSSSTRSTARGPPWPGSSRAAYPSPPRRCARE